MTPHIPESWFVSWNLVTQRDPKDDDDDTKTKTKTTTKRTTNPW